MLVSLTDITIEKRKRKLNEEKVPALMESIQALGLLNPVSLTEDKRLIAGLHRLEACRRLQWEKIPVTLCKLSDLDQELAEIDENLIRNELTQLEQALSLARRKEIYEAKFPETKAGKHANRANQHTGARVEERHDVVLPLSFSEDTAAKTGASKRTAERKAKVGKALGDIADLVRGTAIEDNQKELLKLSQLPKPQQKKIAKAIAAGQAKSVKQAKVQEQAEQLREEPAPLPTGPFRVLVIDPPWSYDNRAEDATHRAANPYPSMSIDQIKALPVADLSKRDAFLWLWTTNAHLPEAFGIVAAWGFTYKTLLTWVKERMGTGDWLRGQTEHCLLAIKGKPVIQLKNQTTVIHGPLREHSRKPDSFYELVEQLCPAGKNDRVDLFSRQEREQWLNYGDQRQFFPAK